MKSILVKVCWALFVALIALFISVLTPLRQYFSGNLEVFPGIPLIILGILLVVLTVCLITHTLLKGFMLATGVAAIGWSSSLFLHGFLYLYFPTEPVTYLLFFFVFPIIFIMGAIGSIIVGLIGIGQKRKTS